MTVGEKNREWIDEIGADGLTNPMYSNECFIPKDQIIQASVLGLDLVPAFRHADGSYHPFPEYCARCEGDNAINCFGQGSCLSCKDWLAHQETTK